MGKVRTTKGNMYGPSLGLVYYYCPDGMAFHNNARRLLRQLFLPSSGYSGATQSSFHHHANEGLAMRAYADSPSTTSSSVLLLKSRDTRRPYRALTQMFPKADNGSRFSANEAQKHRAS